MICSSVNCDRFIVHPLQSEGRYSFVEEVQAHRSRLKNLSCLLATRQPSGRITNPRSAPGKWGHPNLRSGHRRCPDGVDVHGHFDRVRSATEDNAVHKTHVSVVAADTDRHVLD